MECVLLCKTQNVWAHRSEWWVGLSVVIHKLGFRERLSAVNGRLSGTEGCKVIVDLLSKSLVVKSSLL